MEKVKQEELLSCVGGSHFLDSIYNVLTKLKTFVFILRKVAR